MRCLSRSRRMPAPVTRPKSVKDNCFAAFFSRPFPLMSRANGVEIAIITEPFLPTGSAPPPIVGRSQAFGRQNAGFCLQRTHQDALHAGNLASPCSSWYEPCALRYPEGDDGH